MNCSGRQQKRYSYKEPAPKESTVATLVSYFRTDSVEIKSAIPNFIDSYILICEKFWPSFIAIHLHIIQLEILCIRLIGYQGVGTSNLDNGSSIVHVV